MKFRTILLGLSALFVAFNAAFFSVTGLSKLFAGSETSVILMASSLEAAKLMAAGFLHNYWDKINTALKIYLSIAVFVLIIVTSGGIYGFLTSAYQTTADQLSILDRQTEILELKKDRFQEQLNNYNTEKNTLNESINELTKGLSNNVIQYTDSTGRLITTTSVSTRRVLNAQLDESKTQRDLVSSKIEAMTDSVTQLDIKILEIQSSNELAAEVGPLKYISDVTGKDMSTIVNYFALLIIFVFDPLAVTLVIAFNSAISIDSGERDKKKAETHRGMYGEGPSDEPDGGDVDERSEHPIDYKFELSDYDENDFIMKSSMDDKSTTIDTSYKNDDSNEEGKSETDVITINDKHDTQSDDVNNETNEKISEDLSWNDDDDDDDDAPEPNDNLKRAARRHKEYISDTTDKNNPADLNKDGVVTEEESRRWYEEGGWKQPYNGRPYFYHPWFDWSKKERWKNDPRAVNHWLNSKGGSLKSIENTNGGKYPTDFSKKTY